MGGGIHKQGALPTMTGRVSEIQVPRVSTNDSERHRAEVGETQAGKSERADKQRKLGIVITQRKHSPFQELNKTLN